LLTAHCVGTAIAIAQAQAQPARLSVFSIRPMSASEALIDFAVQANISIGGVNACRGTTAGLSGRFTVEDGLTRLLAKTGCGFRRVAPDTVRVFALSRPAPPAPAAPGPGSRQAPAVDLPDTPEVVVTTTKRAAMIGSLPYAVSALNQSQLEEAGALDVGDVAVQIPGLSTTNLGLGRDKILLRGLSDGVFTGRTQSTVGIYLDDAPITYNAPDPDLQLADVEAIEVMRGPQGALYGGGAISGIYRIITNKPSLDAWSGYARAGASLTNAGAPSQEYEAMVNAPLSVDQIGVRAVAYKTVDGGYIDESALRLNNVDQTVREGGRAAVRAALGQDWLVTLTTAVQSIDATNAQYVTPGGGRLHVANQILESSTNYFTSTALDVEHNALWGDLKSTTSFVQHKYDSRSDASNALPLFGLGSPAAGSYMEPIDINMLAEDLVLSSASTGRLQWLTGLNASSTDETTLSIVRAGDSAALTNSVRAQTVYLENRTDQRDSAAAYGDASYAITARLTATAGGRLNWSHAETKSDVTAPLQNADRLYSGQLSGAGFTPKFALAYQPAPAQTLYVTAAEGRRTRGVNTGGPIGTVFLTSSNPPSVHRFFGGDHLWNFEGGAKASAFDGRLSVNADVFYDLWSNIQTDQFMSSGLSYTANAGDGRNVGAELELIARPLTGFTLQGTALVDHPELIRPAPGFTAGAGLPGVPDVSLGARAAYRWRLRGDLTALAFAESQYVGRSHLTFGLNSPTQGGYVLTRLSAQLQKDSWRVAFFLSNPTNARGNTFAYGNPFNFRQAQEITPEQPTTIRGVLSKQF